MNEFDVNEEAVASDEVLEEAADEVADEVAEGAAGEAAEVDEPEAEAAAELGEPEAEGAPRAGASAAPSGFGAVNERLKEIVEAVSNEDLPLDEALDLFEEAVALGTQASNLLEEDIAARNAAATQAELDATQAEFGGEESGRSEGAVLAAAPAPAEEAEAASGAEGEEPEYAAPAAN